MIYNLSILFRLYLMNISKYQRNVFPEFLELIDVHVKLLFGPLLCIKYHQNYRP